MRTLALILAVLGLGMAAICFLGGFYVSSMSCAIVAAGLLMARSQT